MMMPVVRSPPERTSLYRSRADHGKDKLCDSGSLKTAVGKIAVIEAGNGKHPDKVKHGAKTKRLRAKSAHQDR